MAKTIIILFSVVLLLYSFKSSDWTKEQRKVYMKSCVDTASESMSKKTAKKYCTCTLKKIEVQFPDPTQLSNISEEVIMKIAMECVKN